MKVRFAAVLFASITALGAAMAQSSPESMSLSLKEAIAQAIEHNLDIAVARLDPKSSAEGINLAEAGFESSLEARASFARSQEEPSNSFSAEKRDNTQLSTTYTDPLQTGGRWQVGLDYSDSSATYPAGSERFGLIPNQSGASLTGSFTQPLLRNFGLGINRIQIEQAKNNLKISEAQLTQRVISVVEQTEAGYWTVFGARKSLDVARTSKSLAEDFLKQTKVRVEVGTLPPIEITNAEAQVASREESVIVAENSLRDSEDQLRQLMRVDPSSPDWGKAIIPSDTPDFRAATVDYQAAIDTALKNRKELDEAQLNLRNIELDEKYRTNQLRPALDLTASYSASGNNFEFVNQNVPASSQTLVIDCDGNPLTPEACLQTIPIPATTTLVRQDKSRTEPFKEIPKLDNTNWSVGAVFTLPIGNRAAKANLARTRLQKEQVQLNIEKTRQTIRVEVRQAARGLESSAQRVASAKSNVVLQRKKLDAEQKRFENGLSTSFQVLQAQNDLQDSENAQTAAEVSYSKALSRLAAAQGTLLAERGVTLAE